MTSPATSRTTSLVRLLQNRRAHNPKVNGPWNGGYRQELDLALRHGVARLQVCAVISLITTFLAN